MFEPTRVNGCGGMKPPRILVDEAAATWLVSVTESTEADGPLATLSPLFPSRFPCVVGVGVLDIERGEDEEAVKEVVVEVEAVELVELTELWLNNVDEEGEACSYYQ